MGTRGLPDLSQAFLDGRGGTVGDLETLRAARRARAGTRMSKRAYYLEQRTSIRSEARQGSGGYGTFPRDQLPAPHAGPRRSGQPGRGATCLRALQKPNVSGARRAPAATG